MSGDQSTIDERSGPELIDFWNRRAEHFPRFSENENRYESSLLDLAKSRGVVFKGKRVLDVGCGTGMFTLRIAQEALSVTGVDLSDRMLEIHRADADALGLRNVELVKSGWLEYEPPGPFEVVFCSMCPAMKDEAAREKLLASTSEVLVHVGFEEYFVPGPLETLIRRYGVERKRFRSGPEMSDWLTARGESHERLPSRGEWTTRHDRQGGASWCRTMLEDLGASPDKEAVEEALAPYWSESENAYVVSTPYSVEVLLWRPGQR